MGQDAALDLVVRLPTDTDADIVCEDNLNYMRRLDEDSIQLIVTSPPYKFR